MTKKTDEKNTKDDDKDLENEEAENESEEDEDEEDEETSDEDEDEDDEDDEDEEDEEAAPAKPSGGKAAEHRRPRHEEYLAGDEASSGPAEDPTWWAPHAVLGVLVLLGVLGFLGVFNKALGFLAPKPSGAETTTEQKATTTARPGSPGQQPPTAQQPQPPREMFGAKHLLVMYKGSKRAPATIERTKEEAKARATEAAKKAKADPSKFADLVKEYSDEPGAGDRGGDLGKFPKGAMVPEFQAGLEKIKVGEISDVVESAFGFHVILRTQ